MRKDLCCSGALIPNETIIKKNEEKNNNRQPNIRVQWTHNIYYNLYATDEFEGVKIWENFIPLGCTRISQMSNFTKTKKTNSD